MNKYILVIIALLSLNAAYSQSREKDKGSMKAVKEMAEKLISTGFTAGDGYGEVWIRDFNTFMALSCHVNEQAGIKKHLLTFFKFQQPDGQILDGYIPVKKSTGGYKYYSSSLAPEYAGHKNTVETDQETSLIQAVAQYVKSTKDFGILKELIDGVTVQNRMEKALKWLMSERFSKQYGLLWGATTVDWGDVQPETPWGVEMDESSHLAIDIYDNSMFVIAIHDYLKLIGTKNASFAYWTNVQSNLKKNIRKHLWDSKLEKFKPHIYLKGSPFPSTFNENEIYYHGGTIVAIEAGILTKEEVRKSYEKMKENVKKANASSIGLTIYPVYPEGYFKNPGMKPYSYQNGGDWTWFGGRMIAQLVRHGFINEAHEALKPMLARVLGNKGFYEWYTPDNQPKGSSSFRGEAGVLWQAIKAVGY
jgi:glycogen debranching enzyme